MILCIIFKKIKKSTRNSVGQTFHFCGKCRTEIAERRKDWFGSLFQNYQFFIVGKNGGVELPTWWCPGSREIDQQEGAWGRTHPSQADPQWPTCPPQCSRKFPIMSPDYELFDGFPLMKARLLWSNHVCRILLWTPLASGNTASIQEPFMEALNTQTLATLTDKNSNF